MDRARYLKADLESYFADTDHANQVLRERGEPQIDADPGAVLAKQLIGINKMLESEAAREKRKP